MQNVKAFIANHWLKFVIFAVVIFAIVKFSAIFSGESESAAEEAAVESAEIDSIVEPGEEVDLNILVQAMMTATPAQRDELFARYVQTAVVQELVNGPDEIEELRKQLDGLAAARREDFDLFGTQLEELRQEQATRTGRFPYLPDVGMSTNITVNLLEETTRFGEHVVTLGDLNGVLSQLLAIQQMYTIGEVYTVGGPANSGVPDVDVSATQ